MRMNLKTTVLRLLATACLVSAVVGLTSCQSGRFGPDSAESLAEFPYFGKPNANVPPRKSGISRGE